MMELPPDGSLRSLGFSVHQFLSTYPNIPTLPTYLPHAGIDLLSAPSYPSLTTMAPLRSLLATGFLLLSAANAHFELYHPPSLEGGSLDDTKQSSAPCGGGVPDLSQNTATDFHVDGDYVQVFLGHSQGRWLIRGTLDDKAGGNWTQLFPIVLQSSRGNFCEPIVTAPKEWVGKKGFLGVNSNAGDGILYQCAAVNFVNGSAPTPTGNSCVNGSAVTGDFDGDSDLSALVGSSGTSSPPPAASTPGGSAASSLIREGLPFGVLAAALLLGIELL
ncbi:hypothetical protein QBC35DRAFT_495951 [Podospora australis]|uniref:Copper acquisition factor BIM1-like domain-containing protein n=1 Tax=Podospora australis TaxID=1536484 RepID=A0AAN6WUU2_9PEZI|nr:hypothetical protein QBC35DRAFT_495951 [Podospora australis]